MKLQRHDDADEPGQWTGSSGLLDLGDSRLRVRAMTLQASDHPWILQMPATRYLISWVAQRDG